MHPSRGILPVFESLFPAMCAILLAHMAGLSPFSCQVVILHGTHGTVKAAELYHRKGTSHRGRSVEAEFGLAGGGTPQAYSEQQGEDADGHEHDLHANGPGSLTGCRIKSVITGGAHVIAGLTGNP